MQQPKNNKYIVFPGIMILLTVVFTFSGYSYGGIFQTLNKYDVTGLTKVFMYMMLILELAMLGFCIYKGVKAKEEGFEYLFSKFACIIFGVFIIVPMISYFVVIGAEENAANELIQREEYIMNKLEEESKSSSKKKNKKTEIDKQLIDYLDSELNEEFYERKKDIVSENKNVSKGERFLKQFVINGYNFDVFNSYHISETNRYYAIFSRFSVINILCLIFYFVSWSIDRRMNRMRNC